MPTELYVAGKLPDTRIPAIAIVGSRKPTAYGKEVTYRLAYDIARQGVVIISGLAYGIDAVAHRAALDAGGTTIAVLANGLHRVYPAAHIGLAQEIIEKGGAIISEHPLGVEAHRYHFLARNRLVSGLADAVLVTEAMNRSGTTSTIAHAYEQNKEVFAVPGPITSLLSVGPNRALQTGAHVVIEAKDITDIIAPHLSRRQTTLPLGNTPLEVKIISLIQQGIHDGDTLQSACTKTLKCSSSEFLQTLTLMELNGIVRNMGAHTWWLSG